MNRKGSLLLCAVLTVVAAACMPQTPASTTPCETDAECVLVIDACNSYTQVAVHVDDADAYRGDVTQNYCRATPLRNDTLGDARARQEAVCRNDLCQKQWWLWCDPSDDPDICVDSDLGVCSDDDTLDTPECSIPVE